MKRTKRYGGFRIGDRVRVKGKQYKWLKEGVVKALTDGYCSVYFKENSELLSEPVHYCFMPNQLINLTRIEEKKRRITDPLPPFPKGLAEELNKRCEGYLKIINQDDFMKDFKPTPFENLLKRERQERERNKEQLDKFTRKHFNQSADEYLKGNIEMTKKIIEDFGKPFEMPVFDWRATDFGEIQNDWSTKDLSKEEIKMARDIVNEALRQTKIFLSPLSPCSDLPYPYTRDVYSTTKDYPLPT